MAPFGVLASAALAYLLGSLPVGILVARLYGRDPRQVGSGRTGASNVYRTVGLAGGLATAAGDILKATLAVWLVRFVVPFDARTLAEALAALAVIVGHNHSVFLGFRGGAGGTPNAGALLAIAPAWFVPAALLAGGAWLVVRIASVATLTLSAMALVATLWLVVDGVRPPELLVYGVGQLALVVWALRPNIARLMRGEERRIALDRAHRRGEAGEADEAGADRSASASGALAEDDPARDGGADREPRA